MHTELQSFAGTIIAAGHGTTGVEWHSAASGDADQPRKVLKIKI
jgi:hypothetical protein